MSTPASCAYLEWDSNFFGLRIARLSAARLRGDAMPDILAWCRDHAVDCLYFLAAADDPEGVRTAEAHGFHLVDVRVTLECVLAGQRVDAVRGVGASMVIRPSRAADVPALRAIARSAHGDTRFYADPHFARGHCDALYETWIDKSCNGYADVVLVAESGGYPIGYLSCHVRAGETGEFGLAGVAAKSRGAGIGQALVREALRWFANRGIERVTTVTQGRNVKAQRLFQRCGFRTAAVALWYHRWFTAAEGIPA